MGIEKLNEMAAKVEAAQAEVLFAGQAAFKEACADVFERHKGLEQFSWRQFTPYFNDGDACYFYVEGYSLEIGFSGRTIGEEVGDDYDHCPPETADEEAVEKDCRELVDFLERVPDVAEAAFGDHVTVTVSRGDNGVEITTDEYVHD